MSLINVCYEQIKDNFWYGIFGDFKLVIDKNTGYFNATKLCASGGKHFYHWLQNKHSKSLVEYLNLPSNGIPCDAKNKHLKEVAGGNCKEIRGTYVCDDLILAISTWISPEFYIKCNRIIKDYFIGDFITIKDDNVILEHRIKEIDDLLQQIRVLNSELTSENTQLAIRNELLLPIAAPYTIDPKLHNCFVIFKKNNPNEAFPYGVIRIQKRNLYLAIQRVVNKHPDYTVVYKKIQDPNSVKLYHLMKQELNIISKGYSFQTEMSEEELIAEVDSLYDQLLE